MRTALLICLALATWAGDAPRQSSLTVSVAPPRHETWPELIRADGDIAAWQEAAVSCETGGLRIAALHAGIGDTVRAGQVLAEADTAILRAQLVVQEAEVAQADAGLSTAAADARRVEELRSAGTLTAQQAGQYLATERAASGRLAAAQAQLAVQRLTLERSRIVAPDDGVVIARSAVVGQVVAAGSELFRLIRQGRLEWRAEVIADDLARIRPGQAASLAVQGAGRLAGTVRSVAPVLSAHSRTAVVYVDLPAGAARAGMFASGEIAAGEAEVLCVAASAIVVRDGRSLVFTVDADGTARERRVATGRRRSDLVEIASGLTADARVVVTGAAFLGDGDRVAVAP